MHINRNTKPFIPFVAGWLLLLPMACTDEMQSLSESGEEETGTGSFVTVRLTSADPLATRGNPTGGEPGDGSETGFDYENRIDDLTLLFYQADEQSNAPASTPIDKIFYFDRAKIQGDNRTEPVQVNLPAGEYDLLAIANAGDLRQALQGKTLGGIRDYLLRSAWTESDGAYSRFVMTSDGHTEDKVTLCGNPKNEPANATVEVERVAARIDYRSRFEEYEVADKTYGRGKAVLSGAVILNRMSAGSYLLKRVAAPVNGALTSSSPLTYLGDELPVEGGIQRNYVVDPWSLIKTSENATRNAFNPDAGGSGNQPASSLYTAYYTSFGDEQEEWEDAIRQGTQVGDWYRLGYTLENTMSREAQSDAYRTMVVFQAQYPPAG